MNQTIALIITIVVTNWTEIGEVRDKFNRLFSIQEGQIMTNTVVDVPWGDKSTVDMTAAGGINLGTYEHINRFVLKSIPGPVLSERKAILISNLYVTNITWITNSVAWAKAQTNFFQPIPKGIVTNIWLFDPRTGKKTHWIPTIKLEDETTNKP